MKITDKMRLDFLSKHDAAYRVISLRGDYFQVRRKGVVMGGECSGKTLRQAIDAAIRSERSARKGGGNK